MQTILGGTGSMNEVKGTEFKSIINGQEVKLKLKDETLDIERKCDTEYHLAYTELMQRGIMPRATLERYMHEKNIWTKENEVQLQDLQTQIVQLQIELEKAETHEKGLTLARSMGELRASCLRLVEVKANVLSNSCESLADEIRRDAYLAYATVYADTNKPVFKDYADFIRRASDSEQVVIDARQMMLALASQSFNDSLSSLPEVGYVQKVEKQIIEDAEKLEKDKQAKEEQPNVEAKPAKTKATKKTVKSEQA
jgi:hypothetical protein